MLRGTIKIAMAAAFLGTTAIEHVPAVAQERVEWSGPEEFPSLQTCLEAAAEIGDQARRVAEEAWEIVLNADPRGPWTPPEARKLYDESSRLYDLSSEAMHSCVQAFQNLPKPNFSETIDMVGLLAPRIFERNMAIAEMGKKLEKASDSMSQMSRYLALVNELGANPSDDSIMQLLIEINFNMLEERTPRAIAEQLRINNEILAERLKITEAKIASIDDELAGIVGSQGDAAVENDATFADLGSIAADKDFSIPDWPPSTETLEGSIIRVGDYEWPVVNNDAQDGNVAHWALDGEVLMIHAIGWKIEIAPDGANVVYRLYRRAIEDNMADGWIPTSAEMSPSRSAEFLRMPEVWVLEEEVSAVTRVEFSLFDLRPASSPSESQSVEFGAPKNTAVGSHTSLGLEATLTTEEAQEEQLPFTDEPLQGDCIEINGEIACR